MLQDIKMQTNLVIREKAIAKIAKDSLGLETIETRNSDSLDFHELGVWQIKEALELAYKAGQNANDSIKRDA